MRTGYLSGAYNNYVWDYPDGDYPARLVVFTRTNRPVVVVDENERIISNTADDTHNIYGSTLGHKNGDTRLSQSPILRCSNPDCRRVFPQWRKKNQQKRCSGACKGAEKKEADRMRMNRIRLTRKSPKI